MSKYSYLFLAYLIGLVGGTGAYNLSSIGMNAIWLICLIALFWKEYTNYKANGLQGIQVNKFKSSVVLIYVGFLAINMYRETIFDTEAEFNFMPEGGIIREYTDILRGFVLFYITCLVYESVKYYSFIYFLPLLSQSILLISQILEANGVINFSDEYIDPSLVVNDSSKRLAWRPGGFLDPNMTTSVAMIWLYFILELKDKVPAILKGISLLLTLSICFVAQSRAALLFLSLFILYNIFVTRNFKFLLVIIISGIALVPILNFIDIDIIDNIFESFTERTIHKDESAIEREWLVYKAFHDMQDAPIFGHGYFYLGKHYRVSSHNQILEIMNNFGLVGFLVYIFFFFSFYFKKSFSYLFLCIFPTLLFTHSFFDMMAFQVALGFAYTQTTFSSDKNNYTNKFVVSS